MGKKRYIDTKFWSDDWVLDELNPLDRYLFLYLMCNDRTNIAGVYELSLKRMAFDTGIEQTELIRMLSKLESRVVYDVSWVVMRNGIKHQNYTNPKVAAGIRASLAECPPRLMQHINLPADFEIDHPAKPAGPSDGKRSVKASKRYRILKRDGFTCQACGRKAPDVTLHVDHIKPISKGGNSEDANLRTLCSDCNLGKADAHDESSLGSKSLDSSSRLIKTYQDLSHHDIDSDIDSDIDIDSNSNLISTTDVVEAAEKPPVERGNPEINELFEYWHQATGIQLTAKRQANRNACNNLLKKHGIAKVRQLIDGVALAQTDRYAPRISDFQDLQSKLNDLLTWGKTKRGGANGRVAIID